MKKECKTFNCDKYRYNKCCYYCIDKQACKNRCLNTPAKCGLYIQNIQKTNNEEIKKIIRRLERS